MLFVIPEIFTVSFKVLIYRYADGPIGWGERVRGTEKAFKYSLEYLPPYHPAN